MNNIMYYLENSAQRYGSKTAVIDENDQCTYEQLRDTSCRVAAYLQNRKIQNNPIIIFMDKGIDALYAFFGVAYSQNYYSLLNPDLPEARLKQIIAIIETPYMITCKNNYIQAAALFPKTHIFLIEEMKKEEYEPKQINNLLKTTIDINPLYLNFTSGSTGIPKGVLISHQSTIDFIDDFTATFSLSQHERIGNQAPFDFDVSVKDIYSCLKTGATLVIIPRRLFSRPVELIEYICFHQITTLIWAVSALSLICTFHGLDYRVPESVSKVMFSGEIMPVKHLRAWQKALPEAMFVNLYGPTEITCNCTYHIIDRDRNYEDVIPIGKAFHNEEVFLVDEQNKMIQEPHTAGEICVRGRTLALGYYNNSEETQKRFVQDPRHQLYHDRVYLTGDLGYFNQNHELVFCGRKDFQIKYQGHRIEMEEIEKKALDIAEVFQCCCLCDEKHHRLYAFYVGNIDKSHFAAALKKSLPGFMIPGKIYQVEAMPLTKNGKIDRQLLLHNAQGGKYHGSQNGQKNT